ncbi:MAG: transketolase, partial [Armatimonadota bacterium]
GSMLLYALLHLSGYDLPMEELMRFRQLNSMTPGHPESQLTPGVEMATGPLGQGLAHAVGQAMAERFLAARFNRPGHTILDHHTYVIVSDGDLMEGISSEAASLAGHHRLGKLILLYDSNQISIDGSIRRTFTEDVRARFDAFGWQTLLVEAGNDIEAISAAIDAAKADQNRPSLIEIRTVIGFGSPAKAGTAKSHGSPLGLDEVTAAKKALGLPDTAFYAPPEAYAFFALAAEKGKEERTAFEERMDRYRAAFPTEAAELERVWAAEWDESWLGNVEGLDTAAATRKHGETVLQAIAAKNPTVLGGSADLFESTFTHVKDSGPFEPENPTGRNIYFGVREHAMAAAVNGMTMHGGVKPIA